MKGLTFDQIKRVAALQMDEDASDLGEMDELLGAYINEGYHIALREYVRPQERMTLTTDEDGRAFLSGGRMIRITELADESGRRVPFELSADGEQIITGRRSCVLFCVAQTDCPDMKEASDTPRMPETAHGALADYACFRYLSNGNLAKQSRAQHYYQCFVSAMRRIRPQGMGSVTRYRGLYDVTDTRYGQ